MTSIELIYNAGFSWYSKGCSHVKGFAHVPGGQYLEGEVLLDYFNASTDFAGFKSRVSEANGMFSVIVSGEGKTWLAVDRIRSFPVFYYLSGESGMLISDSVDKIINSVGEWNMNEEARTEFLATGYITGSETLVKGISQVQAAEVIEIYSYDEIRVQQSIYSSYRTERVPNQAIGELEGEFNHVTNNVFQRLTGSLQGRTAVIALSGGYDSRYIVAMLKKLNYPEIICFSYGRKGNPDMLIAEKVAGILGLKFIPIVYTEEMIRNFPADKKFRDYVRFTSNKTSMFFMQEYFAIKYLSENSLIPEDSVFISGHSGDFFGGSQMIKHGLHDGNEPIRNTVRRLFNTKYIWKKPGGLVKKSMLDRIGRTMADKDIVPGALPYSVHEDWDLKEKLAKFLVNSCNVYAWFGYEYRLPLYDNELQDFFRDVPFEYKSGKKLYDKYLTEKVFDELDLNFEHELQPDEKTQRMARIKGKIKSILPDLLIPTTVSRQDPIFYCEITGLLSRDLANRGVDIGIRANRYNSLILRWYIEHLNDEITGT